MLRSVMRYRDLYVSLRVASRVAACITISLCMLSALTAQSAQAQWSGGIEGGTVLRDAGNATRLRLTLSNDQRPLTHYLYLEWMRGANDADGYSLGYNPRYWLNETYYAFAESRFRQDEPLGIDQEIKLVGGVGGQFIREDNQNLYIEAGLGGRSIEFDGIEEASNEALGLARLGYFRTLADTIKFDALFSGTQSSDEVTEASSEFGLSLRIPSGAVRVAYRTRYLQVGDNDSISDDDTFVSFDYGF